MYVVNVLYLLLYEVCVFFRFHTPDEERPFVCKYCPRGFLNQCQLDDHVARAHEGRRPYPCRAQGCTRAFTLPGVRKRHEKRDHNLCINLKRGMRSRSEINSGLHLQSAANTSINAISEVCQALPEGIQPIDVSDQSHQRKYNIKRLLH